jgi:hypothetical protein
MTDQNAELNRITRQDSAVKHALTRSVITVGDGPASRAVRPATSEDWRASVLYRIRVEHARSPKDLAVNVDDPNLGVMVRRICLR